MLPGPARQALGRQDAGDRFDAMRRVVEIGARQFAPPAPVDLEAQFLRLRVGERTDEWADVTVESGSKLSDRKGVAVPEAVVPVSGLTPKDREDLAFALRIGVDWVALSCVQKAEDMAVLKQIVKGRAACLAKIEKPQALAELESILDSFRCGSF